MRLSTTAFFLVTLVNQLQLTANIANTTLTPAACTEAPCVCPEEDALSAEMLLNSILTALAIVIALAEGCYIFCSQTQRVKKRENAKKKEQKLSKLRESIKLNLFMWNMQQLLIVKIASIELYGYFQSFCQSLEKALVEKVNGTPPLYNLDNDQMIKLVQTLRYPVLQELKRHRDIVKYKSFTQFNGRFPDESFKRIADQVPVEIIQQLCCQPFEVTLSPRDLDQESVETEAKGKDNNESDQAERTTDTAATARHSRLFTRKHAKIQPKPPPAIHSGLTPTNKHSSQPA